MRAESAAHARLKFQSSLGIINNNAYAFKYTSSFPSTQK